MIGGVILCVGDSMTNGARSPRAYPHILADKLSRQFEQSWIGINKGINGQTSCDLLNRFYDELKRYPEAHEVIFTIGSNDAKDSVATSLEVYAANWRYFIACAEFLKKKLYIGLIPDMVGFGAPDYSNNCNKRIKQYNEHLMKTYGHKYEIIDFTGIPATAYSDGVHCNLGGYTLMAERAFHAICRNRCIADPNKSIAMSSEVSSPRPESDDFRHHNLGASSRTEAARVSDERYERKMV